ncbi:RNA-binding domain-containing protein [Deltaproteobacteria bacterium TL4]
MECKAAQGRDGRGEIPQSIWETYSAMANTSGGHIWLGIEETEDHQFICRGIKEISRLQKALWDTLNARNKVSKNILSEADVTVLSIGSYQILDISVPRARRQDRPIYLGTTPLGNTFVRRHEGDYKADDETVRRMIAESVEDSRDDRILEHFGMEDLDKDSVNAYRNRFSALKPESPWLDLSMEDFLLRIGAMGKERHTGKIGLRVAGLLMFGRYDTIKEEFPYYMVDYQECPESKTEARWIDRLIPDGTWSGNLYDFYQKTIRKLTSELKVPFQLQAETRIDDTPIHQALREALTNTLIHADYTGRISVLVVKRPDLFVFRNPGLMRVSLDQALTGGISDCRNHRIQDLFRYIGLGEHAGSGIPGILKSWKSQHWRTPILYEDHTHEQLCWNFGLLAYCQRPLCKILFIGLVNDFLRFLSFNGSFWSLQR